MRKKSLKNFERKTKNEKFEQSHNAKNSEKRDPLEFLKIVWFQIIKMLLVDPKDPRMTQN